MKNKTLTIRRIEQINNKLNKLRTELSQRNLDSSKAILAEIKELTSDLLSIVERENN